VSGFVGPIRIIANPSSARGKGGRILPELERTLAAAELDYFIERTEGPGHARALARALRSEAGARLLVVGGDGTVHEVVSGLIPDLEEPGDPDALPALAVLPMGTGNDFFRMVRAPHGVDGAVRVLREGVPRAFEVGVARWEGGASTFVNLVGVGIDVEVLRRRAAFERLPGILQYLGALGAALRRFRPVPVRIRYRSAGGRDCGHEGSVLLCAVTVGPSVGGGFLLSPRARGDDGLLDLFLVGPLGALQVARYLPGVLRGTLSDEPGILQEQVTWVEIRPQDGDSLRFELDGELIPRETACLEISVRPRSLRFLELPQEGR